jgi:hypothetical protein
LGGEFIITAEDILEKHILSLNEELPEGYTSASLIIMVYKPN